MFARDTSHAHSPCLPGFQAVSALQASLRLLLVQAHLHNATVLSALLDIIANGHAAIASLYGSRHDTEGRAHVKVRLRFCAMHAAAVTHGEVDQTGRRGRVLRPQPGPDPAPDVQVGPCFDANVVF